MWSWRGKKSCCHRPRLYTKQKKWRLRRRPSAKMTFSTAAKYSFYCARRPVANWAQVRERERLCPHFCNFLPRTEFESKMLKNSFIIDWVKHSWQNTCFYTFPVPEHAPKNNYFWRRNAIWIIFINLVIIVKKGNKVLFIYLDAICETCQILFHYFLLDFGK